MIGWLVAVLMLGFLAGVGLYTWRALKVSNRLGRYRDPSKLRDYDADPWDRD